MAKSIPWGLPIGNSDYLRIVMQIVAAILVLVVALGLMGQSRNEKAKSSARFFDAAMCMSGGSGLTSYKKDNPITCIYNRQGCILRFTDNANMKKHTPFCPNKDAPLPAHITIDINETITAVIPARRTRSNSGSQVAPSPSPAVLNEEDEVQQQLPHFVTLPTTIIVPSEVKTLLSELLDSSNFTSVDYAFGQLVNASLTKKLSKDDVTKILDWAQLWKEDIGKGNLSLTSGRQVDVLTKLLTSGDGWKQLNMAALSSKYAFAKELFLMLRDPMEPLIQNLQKSGDAYFDFDKPKAQMELEPSEDGTAMRLVRAFSHPMTGLWAESLAVMHNASSEVQRKLATPPQKTGITYDTTQPYILLASIYSDKSNMGKNKDVWPWHVVPGNLPRNQTEAILAGNKGLCAMLPLMPKKLQNQPDDTTQLNCELMMDCLLLCTESMKQASHDGIWVEFGPVGRLMVLAFQDYRHDNPEGSLVRAVFGCCSNQACSSCTCDKSQLSSRTAFNTAQVKYDCNLDVERLVVLRLAGQTGHGTLNYFRSSKAQAHASLKGVRPNVSGLSGFGFQPGCTDTQQTPLIPLIPLMTGVRQRIHAPKPPAVVAAAEAAALQSKRLRLNAVVNGFIPDMMHVFSGLWVWELGIGTSTFNDTFKILLNNRLDAMRDSLAGYAFSFPSSSEYFGGSGKNKNGGLVGHLNWGEHRAVMQVIGFITYSIFPDQELSTCLDLVEIYSALSTRDLGPEWHTVKSIANINSLIDKWLDGLDKVLKSKESSLAEELQNDDTRTPQDEEADGEDTERHTASNRPKIHSLFHITDSIQTRGLPQYHSTDSGESAHKEHKGAGLTTNNRQATLQVQIANKYRAGQAYKDDLDGGDDDIQGGKPRFNAYSLCMESGTPVLSHEHTTLNLLKDDEGRVLLSSSKLNPGERVQDIKDILNQYTLDLMKASDTTDILYKLLVDQDSRVLLEKLPALLAMSYNKFSLGNHVAQHDKDVQSEISSVSITTTAYILGSTVVGIPSSHPGLDSRFPPKRAVMRLLASPDFFSRPCFSGVLIKIPSYTDRRTSEVHPHDLWRFAQIRIIFESKGCKNEWKASPRGFAVVEFYQRATAENTHLSPHPSLDELALPTRCVRLYNATSFRERFGVIPLGWIIQVVHIAPVTPLIPHDWKLGMSLVRSVKLKDDLKGRDKARETKEGKVIGYVNKYCWGLNK